MRRCRRRASGNPSPRRFDGLLVVLVRAGCIDGVSETGEPSISGDMTHVDASTIETRRPPGDDYGWQAEASGGLYLVRWETG